MSPRSPLSAAPARGVLCLTTLFLASCGEAPTAIRSGPARLTVDSLVVTPVNRAFTVAQGGPAPANAKVTVSSSGAALSGLTVGTITYGAGQPTGWLTTATLSSTTTPATLTLGATPGTLPIGSYKATIPVTAVGAGNNPRVAKVTLNVISAPWLTVTPNLRNFFGPVGGAVPAAKIINISNTGTAGTTLSGLTVSSITYAAGQPTGWLTTASLSSTTAPSTLTLMPAVGALPPGLYNATVAVASPVALKSPVNIAVRFTVSPPLVVNAALISFTSARNGSSDPAVDTILVNQFIHWNLVNGPHTVRSQGSPSFVSSGTLGASGYTLQFTVAGTYQYDCQFHGSQMTGTIVVR